MVLFLLGDQLAQRGLIAVGEFGRIERAFELVDDLLGDGDHLGVGLNVRNASEEIGGIAHLVLGANGVGQQPLVARLQRHHPFALVHDHPRQRHLPRSAHRLADDAEGLDRQIAVRRQEVWVVPVETIDLGLIDESLDVDGAGGFQPHVLDLLVGDDDVAALLDLIALDDVRPLNRPGVRVGGDHPDTVVSLFVQHVERDVGAARRGRVKGHRAAYERQAQITLPGGASGHVRTPIA